MHEMLSLRLCFRRVLFPRLKECAEAHLLPALQEIPREVGERGRASCVKAQESERLGGEGATIGF